MVNGGVNYQKLFRRFRFATLNGRGGGGGGVMTFVLSMCVNFAILAGTVSRVMYKI